MSRSLSVSLVALAAVVAAGPVRAEGKSPKDLFLAGKCNTCHAVAPAAIEAKATSEKMRGPDLAGRPEPARFGALVAYLRKTEMINGKQHKAEWKGSDEDLEAILTWLSELEPAAK
jgi:cytochrome c553